MANHKNIKWQEKLSFTVNFTKEADLWVAELLELRLIGTGGSYMAALSSLLSAARHHVEACVENGWEADVIKALADDG